MRLRVTWICIPSTIGDVALGTTWSLSSSGAPAALSNPATLGAGRCTVRMAPPSLIWTVLGLTTGKRHPRQRNTAAARGRRRGGVSHRELSQRLIHGGCRRPNLFHVVAVQR